MVVDARQACLEGHAAVSHTVSLTHQGAGEEDRGWVQRRVAIGPYRLVGNAVEASVGPKAPHTATSDDAVDGRTPESSLSDAS